MELKDKINIFKTEGIKKIKIISDFDGTFTKQYKNKDTRENNSVSVFRNENYLSEVYSNGAKKLFEKYNKYERDSSLSKGKKTKLMEQWWTEHWALMQKENMNESNVLEVISKKQIKLRSGVEKFVKISNRLKIPLFIFSSGTGNLIEEYLISKQINFSNVKIISNLWKFDEKGKFIGLRNKYIIHSQNKDVSLLQKWFSESNNNSECLIDTNISYFDSIKKKKNVILIGDSFHDVRMCQKYDNIIKIGFISKHLGKDKKKEFDEQFDLVIDDEKGFEKIIKLLNEIYSNDKKSSFGFSLFNKLLKKKVENEFKFEKIVPNYF